MDHSWLSGAAALVIVLGPTATSSDASATAGTVGAPAATTARPALAMTTTAIGGNVIAVVPGAAITGDDHLPPKLDGSHTYRATFLIWVAPNARHPTLKVDAAGGVVRHCSVSKLQPGADSYLTCQVRPDPKHQVATNLTITVVVRTSNLGTYSRSYRHQITK
jgi:hypothetical protein